jgi:glycosyltransferase involved in cell wall biosynthesis
MTKFDLTYATVDSLSEGVGSSQIVPLMEKLSQSGLKINLMTFEKLAPPDYLVSRIKNANINWIQISFGSQGPIGAIARTYKLARLMPESAITHARSDFPAVAARMSNQEKVLWDVRSLWADQRKFIEENPLKKVLFSAYKPFESLACSSSIALSTLTKAVVPVLEERHKTLPKLRTVVPTAVDLSRFKFSPAMPSKFKGLYSGTYNNYYDLELSRKFLEELIQIVDCEVSWARPREVNSNKLNAGERSSFSVTQPEMADVMRDFTFGISICKEDAGASLLAAMPTKIAEFLAIGRPVIVNAGLGDCDDLFKNSKAGLVIGKGDNLRKKALELIELCNDPETPGSCRDLAEKHFSLESGANSYLSTYTKMNKL